jgi:hypothetical protein
MTVSGLRLDYEWTVMISDAFPLTVASCIAEAEKKCHNPGILLLPLQLLSKAEIFTIYKLRSAVLFHFLGSDKGYVYKTGLFLNAQSWLYYM